MYAMYALSFPYTAASSKPALLWLNKPLIHVKITLRHAGSVFFGRHTPEAVGDYIAGPNHVLPTSGTARFSSPLGVYDFQKRSSIIFCSEAGASELGKTASVLARGESLSAHARSAEYRIKDQDFLKGQGN